MASTKSVLNVRSALRPSPVTVTAQPSSKLLSALRRALLGAQTDDSGGTAPALRVEVRCSKCGEIIHARVDKMHELQCEYEETGHADPEEEPHPTSYLLTKELVGARCQNLVHFTMRFDARSRPIERHIDGGDFVLVEECE